MPEQKQSIDDVIGQLSGQLAQAQAIKQQQEQQKKKPKSFIKRSSENLRKYFINPVIGLPKNAAKGVNGLERITSSFSRTAIPTACATYAMLPLLLVNPLGAALAGLGMLAISYVATNTVYKLARDTVYLPKTMYTNIRALGKQGLKPFKAIKALVTLPLRAPFKIFKAALTYPLKSPKRYGVGVDQNGNQRKIVIGGVSPLGRKLGLLVGPAAGLTMAFGGLDGLVSAAGEKITGLYASAKDYVAGSAAAKYAPAYAYR